MKKLLLVIAALLGMEKILFVIAVLLCATTVQARDVKPWPKEFIGKWCAVDDTSTQYAPCENSETTDVWIITPTKINSPDVTCDITKVVSGIDNKSYQQPKLLGQPYVNLSLVCKRLDEKKVKTRVSLRLYKRFLDFEWR